MQVIFTSVNTRYVEKNIINNTKEKLKNEAQILGEVLKYKDVEDYHSLLNLLSTRYTILSPQGVVIYDSKNHENEIRMENHSLRPEIETLGTDMESFNIRISRTFNERMAYYAIGISNFKGVPLVIRTSESFKPREREIINILLLQILFFIILDITILLFYRNYIERSKQKQIEKMTNFLENGTISKEEDIMGDHWLFSLWLVIKMWQERNLQNIIKLEKERSLLGRLINSMDVAILLFDKDMNLIRRNSSLSHLFNSTGKRYLEVINYIEIIDILKETASSKNDIEKEIYLSSEDEYLFVTAKYLTDNEQYILSVKNISSEKTAINNQKRFISNISHELKTPLTNIKGYLIALEDAPESLKDNFLKIINNNVNKLENIVTDFLAISTIENSMKLNVNKIPTKNLVKEIEDILEAILKKKMGRYSLKFLNIYKKFPQIAVNS